MVRTLNILYCSETALHQNNYGPEGFEWIDYNDTRNSVFCWIRKGNKPGDYLVFIANATPQVLHNYRVGVPEGVSFRQILNTDEAHFGGCNTGLHSTVAAAPVHVHGRSHSVVITLPPLAVLVWKPMPDEGLQLQETSLK